MPVKRASGVPGLRTAVAAGQALATVTDDETPAGGPAPAPAARAVPAAAPGPPPRAVKPIRFTLDLSPDLHKFLKRFALDSDTDASIVMRTLLTRLQFDPGLAQQVQADIWQQ